MFAIYEEYIRYCPATDATIGAGYHDTGRRYAIERLAHKIAGRLDRECFEVGGDSSFFAIPVGASPADRRKRVYAAPSLPAYGADEIPF